MTEQTNFVATSAWLASYPGAVAGVLLMQRVSNPDADPNLDHVREKLETAIRDRYTGMTRAEIRATGHFPAYDRYYKRFGQNYHVLMQLDSIVTKGKTIPRRAALVEAGFMAELESGLLTSGHDLNALHLPVTVDVAEGDVTYTLYSGSPQTCKPHDMLMRDQTGVISSIIAGPAQYARITPETTGVAYFVYAPPGIGFDVVRSHLTKIEATIRLFAPNAESRDLKIIQAEG